MSTASKLLSVLVLAAATSFAQAPAYVSGPQIPTGAIILIDGTVLSSCPVGFTEIAALASKSLRGTVAANGDVGGGTGSDTATPVGTNSAPALTMNSYTPAGTNGSVSFTPAGTNGAISMSGSTATEASHTH